MSQVDDATAVTPAVPRSFRLRHAEPADAAAVLDYLRRVGAETPNLSFGAEGPPVTEEQETGFIQRTRGSDNGLFIIADAGGEIVGALTFVGGDRARTRHVGEFGVSVLREWWRHGVGRALMQEMLAWARRSGVVRKINLKVRTDNVRAIAVYERLGFVTEGRLTRDVIIDGEFHDVLMMGLPIDPAT